MRNLLLLSALLFALPGAARSLHWSSLEVEARLDAEGRLRIIERQAMVFDGDWNGGERTFRLEPGQRIELHSVRRIDRASGAVHELRQGDLDEIDEYDWADSSTLRWRSRMPSDPPFSSRTILYELDYTMRGVVAHVGDGGFVLDHDFAFQDRVGMIERFTLTLGLDPAWRPTLPFDQTIERTSLRPGLGVVVTIQMEYVGEGSPGAVEMAVSPSIRLGAGFALLATVGLSLTLLVSRERDRGRFEPLTPADQIDEGWLDANLFTILPEVAGAAWDSSVSSPEVAAMLARMVAEKKLASRTEGESGGMFGRKPALHLELLVSRDELSRPERDLVNGLFPGQRTVTSTDVIREHYKSRGFDPASKIRKGLEKAVKKMYTGSRKLDLPFFLETKVIFLVFAGASAAATATALLNPGSMLAVVLSAIGLTIAFIITVIFAGFAKNTVESAGAWISVASAFLFALLLGAIAVTIMQPLTLFATLAIDLFALFYAMMVVRTMATSNSRSQIELRKRLSSARRFFVQELRKQDPRLKDEWFPWLIAFELGPDVDHWFRSFGGEGATSPNLSTFHGSGSSVSGGSSSAASGWTGGGGAFGGAGATATWVAAAGTISSGVAAPSSGSSGGGSSGGGGGGGSSSGGGGGGGW